MSPDSPVQPTANRSSRAAAPPGSAPITVHHRGHPAARRARPAILLALAVLLVAGCGTGGSGAAGASPAPTQGPTAPSDTLLPTPAPATGAPESQAPVATVAAPSASAAAGGASSAAPSSPAAPATITSPFYAYSLTFPASGWSPQPARTRWDGMAQIDSNGPFVDRATGPGSNLFFVYGAPTDLDLAAWSAKGQMDVNRWHGCPATAESEADITIGGTPGRLHAFHCNSLYVMKAFAVRDGFGWAFNQLSPPGLEPDDTAALTAMLAKVEFTK
jgi:hypothetical protein